MNFKLWATPPNPNIWIPNIELQFVDIQDALDQACCHLPEVYLYVYFTIRRWDRIYCSICKRGSFGTSVCLTRELKERSTLNTGYPNVYEYRLRIWTCSQECSDMAKKKLSTLLGQLRLRHILVQPQTTLRQIRYPRRLYSLISSYL